MAGALPRAPHRSRRNKPAPVPAAQRRKRSGSSGNRDACWPSRQGHCLSRQARSENARDVRNESRWLRRIRDRSRPQRRPRPAGAASRPVAKGPRNAASAAILSEASWGRLETLKPVQGQGDSCSLAFARSRTRCMDSAHDSIAARVNSVSGYVPSRLPLPAATPGMYPAPAIRGPPNA